LSNGLFQFDYLFGEMLANHIDFVDYWVLYCSLHFPCYYCSYWL